MMTAGVALLLIGVLFAVGLFFARRILRLAIKLAVVGAIVFALFAGGLFGWWRGWFEAGRKNQPAATTNKRANPANRTTR
jgi:uncharacterized SAM-binding protein YcdF (DUF218 family)